MGNASKVIIILTLALILAASVAFAEVPQMINYQGRLSDSGGNPIDTTINMTFTICLDSTGGVCIWGESHATVEVVNGLFNVKLGQTTPLTATVFSNDNLWLHFAVGSAKEAIDPPVELVTVPFAYTAANADNAMDIANDVVTSQKIVNGTIQLQDIGSNGAVDGEVIKYNGSQWMADECIPNGVIVMWSGSLASVPDGWALCDGTFGTPDLTDRFIYSVGTGENPGASGGTNNHSHTVDPPGHNTNPTSQTVDVTPGVGETVARDTHNHFLDIPSFGSQSESSLPPYYKLAFIMKQ